MNTTARQRVGWGAANVVVVLIAAIPVLWLVSLSFKDPSTITDGSFYPHKWTTANYRGIFDQPLFTHALVNSIGIALIAWACWWNWVSSSTAERMSCRASAMTRRSVFASIRCCGPSTFTQQPWQRRLQLLMIEMYRNGGKCSPRASRRLNFCTERIPLNPKL